MENVPAVQGHGSDVERFIMAAIDKSVPVETMERLLAMRDKLCAERAKADYDNALAEFQAECPVISKSKEVMDKGGTKVRYRYAPLDSIIGQIKAILQKYGFSYSLTAQIIEKEKANWVEATCKATHKSGHSECSSFRVPIDKDAYMNEQQKVASALTYAKRYAFCNAFGIMTGDEDDDSDAAGDKETAKKKRAAHLQEPRQEAPIIEVEPEEPLAVGTELRIRIDGLIDEAGIDKKDFKAWLFSIKKVSKKFGNPSLSSMSIKDAESMVKNWSAALAKFNSYIDQKNAGQAA
jgi:hypothetical protein